MSTWGNTELLNKPGLPEPRPTELSKPFWEGCKQGELRVQQCQDCKGYVFTPEVACTHCLSDQLQWVTSSGKGTLYSYTVIHRPQRPEFEAPYVAVIIELSEGWHMLSNLLDCDPDNLTIGSPVQVEFVPRGEQVLPMFRLQP
jgi:uncharacterized OB-fold protein